MKSHNLFVSTKKDNKYKWSGWEDCTSEYELVELVGKGSYGQVAKATHKATGKTVAIKMMEEIYDDEEDCKKMVREILLLMEMRGSKHVTRILDIIKPNPKNKSPHLFIVLEYVNADLKKVLKSQINLSEEHAHVIVYNILCALNWVHTSNVLHRDIKPGNILIDEDCCVQICDFGLARSFSGL